MDVDHPNDASDGVEVRDARPFDRGRFFCPDFAPFLKISVGCYRRCLFDGTDVARYFVSLVGSVGSIVSYCRYVEMNRVTEE
jgi:hypothetical protein